MDNSIVDVSTWVTHQPFDTYLVLVQVSAYSTSWATQWGKPRSHGLQRATLYPNPPTKMCCRAMLYDVTQIYDAWYRPRSCCPTSLELQCSRTTLHAKMYPYTDDTLRHRILHALCNRLYVVVQVQHGNRHHDKNQHVQAYPGTLRTWQMSSEVML